MFTLTFHFVEARNNNTQIVTRSGDSFSLTFSGNRIYRYQGVNPDHVLGRVIRTKTSELKGTYVVMKNHTLFSLSDIDDDHVIRMMVENPEVVAVADGVETFRQFMEL